jgi:hypothetical protein
LQRTPSTGVLSFEISIEKGKKNRYISAPNKHYSDIIRVIYLPGLIADIHFSGQKVKLFLFR